MYAAVPNVVLALGQARAIGQQGNPEIGDQHLAIPVDQDVIGLDVPVDDARPMDRGESAQDRRRSP